MAPMTDLKNYTTNWKIRWWYSLFGKAPIVWEGK